MADVLMVAMVDSIHTARWISQFSDHDMKIMLFPSTPHRRIHKVIKELLVGDQRLQLELAPAMRYLALPLTLIDLILRLETRSKYLRYLIKKRKPQILHGLETQHAGYIIADSIRGLLVKPSIYLSLWGSDLFWFEKFDNHKKKITNVLSNVDFLGAECRRDINLASSLGFKGKLLPVVPASGGIDLGLIDSLGSYSVPSIRSKIMIKGYSGFVGRSLAALNALSDLSSQLKEFEIHVYSASLRTIRHAHRIRRDYGLTIICHRKHSLSHSEVCDLLGKSRISISISLSDGFPGSLRESMAMGCFPIESRNSCGSEWAVQNESAFFVDPLNRDEISKAIRIALSDDTLVNSAAEINRAITEERVSTSKINKLVNDYYSSTTIYE